MCFSFAGLYVPVLELTKGSASPQFTEIQRKKKEKLSEAPSQHRQGVPGGVARRVALQWAGAARRPAHAKPFIAYLSHRIKT